MAIKACEDNGYHVDPEIVDFYTKCTEKHTMTVYSMYIHRKCEPAVQPYYYRLPDAYGRGRIGHYRQWLSTEWIV